MTWIDDNLATWRAAPANQARQQIATENRARTTAALREATLDARYRRASAERERLITEQVEALKAADAPSLPPALPKRPEKPKPVFRRLFRRFFGGRP